MSDGEKPPGFALLKHAPRGTGVQAPKEAAAKSKSGKVNAIRHVATAGDTRSISDAAGGLCPEAAAIC
jgi:hypothetical protein